MYVIEAMNDLRKEFFAKKSWWYVVPFSFLAVVGMLFYYALVPFYMAFDLGARKIDELLTGQYDNISGGVLIVRNIVAFFFMLPFFAFTVFGTLILAFVYFLTYVCAFVGCVFKTNGPLFAFHKYLVK